MRDHVVQLAGDPGPLPARGVLQQACPRWPPAPRCARSPHGGPGVRSRPARPPVPARPAARPGSWPRSQAETASARMRNGRAERPRPAAVSRGGRAGTPRPAARPGRPRSASGTRPATDARRGHDQRGPGRPVPQETERQRGGQADQHQDDQDEPPARRRGAAGRQAAVARACHAPPTAPGPPRASRAAQPAVTGAYGQRGEPPPRRGPLRRARHPFGPRNPLSPLVRALASPRAGIPPSLARGMRGPGPPPAQRRPRPLCGGTTPAARLP